MSRRLGLLLAAAMIAGACVGGNAEPEQSSRAVELFGPFRGEEAALLAESLAEFEDHIGIPIRYTGTGSFVADLSAQIRSAAPPDIAFVPQPGLVADLTRDGNVVVLSDSVQGLVEQYYDESGQALGEIDGIPVGVPFRVNAKSLVWYRPSVFAERELSVPTTLDELDRLVGRIGAEADGTAPWCLGIEAQGATGWVATDWVEDLVLRLSGPDVYDQWTSGTVEFADERIAEAFERFRALGLIPGRADGGIAGVLQTPVQASVGGLFSSPPECLLHRQASFAYGWMPAGTTFGPDADVDFFVLPGADGEQPPMLVGSTVAVAFDDRPEVDQVMAHLASPGSIRAWASAGGFISPRIANPLDGELPPADRAVRDEILAADVVRADASDAMTPEIGTDLLWREITDWVADAVTYEQFAATLDEARAEAD